MTLDSPTVALVSWLRSSLASKGFPRPYLWSRPASQLKASELRRLLEAETVPERLRAIHEAWLEQDPEGRLAALRCAMAAIRRERDNARGRGSRGWTAMLEQEFSVDPGARPMAEKTTPSRDLVV